MALGEEILDLRPIEVEPNHHQIFFLRYIEEMCDVVTPLHRACIHSAFSSCVSETSCVGSDTPPLLLPMPPSLSPSTNKVYLPLSTEPTFILHFHHVYLGLHVSVQIRLCHAFIVTQLTQKLTNTCKSQVNRVIMIAFLI